METEVPPCIVCFKRMQEVPTATLPYDIVDKAMREGIPLDTVKRFECPGHCGCWALPFPKGHKDQRSLEVRVH